MRYLSVCSGIVAATVAWKPLGWTAAAFAEIDRFPSAVLAHHYPGVPNFGDFTTIGADDAGPIDLLVGGTPCQSFSVAGLRGGLDDDRGNLALEFFRLAQRTRPRWLVWENVPGVLSSNDGRDFGSILGAMGELGYGFAYRVLDAQYVRVDGYSRAVPQRRRRVFAVGYLGDWRRAAAVLLEPEGLRGDSPPRREAGQGFARDVAPSLTNSGRGVERPGETRGPDPVIAVASVSPALKARDYKGPSSDGDGDGAPLVAHALRAEGFDASEDGTGRGTPNAPIAFSSKDHGGDAIEELSPTLRAMGHAGSHPIAGGQMAVAFDMRGREGGAMPEGPHDTANIREASGGSSRSYVCTGGNNANAEKAGPIEALRALRDATSEETLSEWCLGILAAFWPSEVLQSEVHGRCFRRATKPQRGLVNISLSRSQNGATWTLRDLWEAGCDGCPPQGWQPSEQLARELGTYLSRLPYQSSPAEAFLRDMWQASEGAGVLRKALSAVQEIRRSASHENQSAHTIMQVRRLTVEECEALQGFPRGYTNIPWRGKDFAPDGPRYKAIGNSMAVNVMRWIGRRIETMESVLEAAE